MSATTAIRILTDPSLAAVGEIFVYASISSFRDGRPLPHPSFRPARMTDEGPEILGDRLTPAEYAQLRDGLPELAQQLGSTREHAWEAAVLPEWLWARAGVAMDAAEPYEPTARSDPNLYLFASLTPVRWAALATFMLAVKTAVLWQSPEEIGAAWAEGEGKAVWPHPRGSWQSTWLEAMPLVPALVPEVDREDFATAINEAARRRWGEIVDRAKIARTKNALAIGGVPRHPPAKVLLERSR